jgi:hypothetical protein
VNTSFVTRIRHPASPGKNQSGGIVRYRTDDQDCPARRTDSVKRDKQDRRSLRTRHLIRTAMMELLFERPYDEITVQDILDRANIGRSTFYPVLGPEGPCL